MSIEAEIRELTDAVKEALNVFKNAVAAPVQPVVVQPEVAVQPVAQPVTRQRRGSAAKVEPVAQPQAAADDGGFLDEPSAEPEKTFTEADVRAALIAFQKATNSQEKARKLLKEFGGVDVLSALPKEKYKAVIDAASKR